MLNTQFAPWLEDMLDREAPINATKYSDYVKLFALLPNLEACTSRILTGEHVKEFNANIKNHPVSIRKKAKMLFSYFTQYLHGNLDWEISLNEQKKQRDRANNYYGKIQRYRHISEKLANLCIQNALEDIDQGKTVSDATLLLLLLFDTAPLPFWGLYQILSNRVLIENVVPRTFVLSGRNLNKGQIARYQFGPVSAVYHKQWQNNNQSARHSQKKLKNDLVKLANEQLKESAFSSYQELMDCVTCYWVNRVGHWATEQLATPKKQSSISTERWQHINRVKPSPPKDMDKWVLFNQGVHKAKDNPVKNKESKPALLFKSLLKHYKQKSDHSWLLGELAIIQACHNDADITAMLLAAYMEQLIVHGGMMKETLRIGTIKDYVSIHSILEENPLPISNCFDSENLLLWANKLKKGCTGRDQQGHMQRFFKFLKTFEVTEELPLEKLISPLEPIRIDANVVTPSEYTLAHNALKAQPVNAFDIMCAQAALALGYHGKLRRSEVLKLRVCDVLITEQNGDRKIKRLTITRTKEGPTKSGKTRYVYVDLPRDIEPYLLHLIKSHKDSSAPIIGTENESLAQRANKYLAPVTRALKRICNDATIRFHHLRHGGVFNDLIQLMLATTPSAHLPEVYIGGNTCEALADLYSHDALHHKLNNWFQATPVDAINKQLLFDKICQQIGHSDFSTTRKHYLHGCEWIPALFQRRMDTYERKTLRILKGLKSTSTDIFRIEKKFIRALEKPHAHLATLLCKVTQSTQHDKYETPGTLVNLEADKQATSAQGNNRKKAAKTPYILLTRQSEAAFSQQSRLPFSFQMDEGSPHDALAQIRSLPTYIQACPWPTQMQYKALKSLLGDFLHDTSKTHKHEFKLTKRAANLWRHLTCWLPQISSFIRVELVYHTARPIAAEYFLREHFKLKTKNITYRQDTSGEIKHPKCFFANNSQDKGWRELSSFLRFVLTHTEK